MRSARAAIALTALFLVLSPFLMLAVAWTYERTIVLSYERELNALADRLVAAPEPVWAALVDDKHVWVRRFSSSEEQRSYGDPSTATVNSFLGSLSEGLLGLFGADTPFELLTALETGDASKRPDVLASLGGQQTASALPSPSGQTMVVSVSRALGNGQALLIQRGNHRGVRQLILARWQISKLVLYQVVFALAAVVLLSRWLVKPLEQLTRRARRYPAEPVAEPALLERADEVGQLTRAFSTLTHSLEERRQETVRLAADIAHELKNPLATIAAAAEWVVNTAELSAQKRAHVGGVISESVERLRATTDALLSLVKLESVLDKAPRSQLAYQAWLEALLDSYRSDPQHDGWRFELEVIGAPLVFVAAEAWAGMLRNLIDNARVQPSAERRILLRARVEAEQLFTEVTDFGPGVSAGNREKIFERFFTARPEGVARGTGLGLAIVSAVAQAHDGHVELLPARPGEGATFRVSIRHVAALATPLPQRSHQQSSPGA